MTDASPQEIAPARPSAAGVRRIEALESLRGLASWWVVLGHLAYAFSDRLGYLSSNRSAVDLFFILSGYVIANLMDNRREGYAVFITRRFFRLAPTYLGVLLISAATLGWQARALARFPVATRRNGERLQALQEAAARLPEHLGAHLPMLHGLVPERVLPDVDVSLVGQAWSVSVEWQFYLLAPLVFWAVVRRRAGLALACVGVAVLLAWLARGALAGNSAFVGFAAPWLAAGAAGYAVVKRRDRPWVRRTLWVQVAAMAAVAALLRSPGLLVWVIAWPILLGSQWAPVRALTHLLERPWLKELGRTSYPTYLVHMLVIAGVSLVLEPLHLPPPVFGFAMVGLTLAGVFASALALHVALEKPGMDLGARLARRLATPRPAHRAA